MLVRLSFICLLAILVHVRGQYNFTEMKFRNGRRVCMTTKEVNKPIVVTEPYTKPVFKKFTRKCENDQVCNGFKLIYENSYRDVYKPNYVKVPVYMCCPGWEKDKKPGFGCNEPKCNRPCENGGTCSGYNKCVCTPGFLGKNCETDIDECVVDKPCDHFCFNTKGSYYCSCKKDFVLQDDKQSCRKSVADTNNVEIEEDGEYYQLENRVRKLEKMIGVDDSMENSNELNIFEMKNKLDIVAEDVMRLEHKIKEMEYKQPRVHRGKSRHHQKLQWPVKYQKNELKTKH